MEESREGCMCVRLLLKSNVTAPGYCGDCKGRCCRRRFEVLNDPGVAWLMEWFTQYFSDIAAECERKASACHLLRASRSRSAKPGREPTETTGLLVEFLFHSGPLTHTHMLAVRCMHVNTHTHTHAHMHAHTRPCTQQTFTPGTTPAMRGTSGIPVTCFEEAELICLVRRWEPEDDRVQVRWDWAASRPSCSFTLWNTTYNRNTATHAHLHFAPALFVVFSTASFKSWISHSSV